MFSHSHTKLGVTDTQTDIQTIIMAYTALAWHRVVKFTESDKNKTDNYRFRSAI